MQQSALMDWCDLNTEAKKRIKNKKAGRRSAPHVGENGGLFRYIGAYVAFASFVYHSLVVLVIAFTGPFGYACVTKNEEVSENGVPSRFMRKIICRLRLNEVSRQ